MSPGVYYNDSEPFVCDWLENLIREKLLPAGVVDRRPIQEVRPEDVQGFTQCHFFAGIGGWAYALQLAGWGDRPVWTGSCPCQPFSVAGKGKAEDDPRHLWPSWLRLIRECRPERIVGEQVANATGHGWLDVVSADLEAEAYRVGAVVLGAHSVGAPHLRQRLYFVADAESAKSSAGDDLRRGQPDARRSSKATTVADAPRTGGRRADKGPEGGNGGRPRKIRGGGATAVQHTTSGGAGAGWWEQLSETRPTGWRVVEPAVGRVAHGVSARVGRLRAYGNAIVPQVAEAFVRAYMEVAGL